MLQFGDQCFASYHKARQYHLGLVKKYQALGKRVKVTQTHSDYKFLRAIFKQHHERKRKTAGQKIARFEFGPESGRRSRNWCCYVVNVQGRRCKWSAKHIGKSKHHAKEQTLRQVFRIEIVAQRDQFARQHERIVLCEECEKPLLNRKSKKPTKKCAPRERANVDHNVHLGQPFLSIFQTFIQNIPKTRLDLDWGRYRKRNVQVLKDRELAKQWRKYHKQHCVFRFLCTRCNNQSYNK